MRRLYSTFAGGWPGFGLLVIRLVVGSVLLVRGGAMLWMVPSLYLMVTSASVSPIGTATHRGAVDAHSWSRCCGDRDLADPERRRTSIRRPSGRNHCCGSGHVRTWSLVDRRSALRVEAHRSPLGRRPTERALRPARRPASHRQQTNQNVIRNASCTSRGWLTCVVTLPNVLPGSVRVALPRLHRHRQTRKSTGSHLIERFRAAE